MSRIKQSIQRAAKRIVDDENVREGIATVLSALVGILLVVIRRR